ncbi:MAG: DMT family transporter [Pseudomonadota bacterium]
MSVRDWGLLCTLAMLWGCSFLLMAICLETIPVFTSAFGRLLLAGLLLVGLVVLQRQALVLDRLFVQEVLVLGLLRAALPIALILWAQTRIDSGLAGILNSTSALFTLLVAHWLTDSEKITRYKLIAVLLGMCGVALIMGVNALQGLGQQVIGQCAMLGATLSYGFANVYGRRFSSRAPAVSAAGMLIAGALWVLPLAVWFEWPLLQPPSFRSSVALVLLAAFSTACAFVVWFKLIRSAGPNNTVLVTFLIPPVALGLGMLVLNETPGPDDLIGLIIILAGLWFSQREQSPR